MQRWFYADEQTTCEEHSPNPSQKSLALVSPSACVPIIHWKFCVTFKDELCANERLAVIGNVDVLGNWNIASCLPLEKDGDCSWSISVNLPLEFDILYRYLVIAIDGRGQKLLRYWESHIEPRCISHDQEKSKQENYCVCSFGYKDDGYQVQRGWLQCFIVAVQFKVFNAPFVFKTKSKKYLFQIKIIPVRLREKQICDRNVHSGPKQKLLLESEKENNKSSADLFKDFAFCEVASLKYGLDHFHHQSKYGTLCGPEDLLLFHLLVGDFPNTAYLVNLYMRPYKAMSDVPPYHFGYQHIMPEQLRKSHGSLKIDIMCASKHRRIGFVTLDYVVIKPFPHIDLTVEQTISNRWKSKTKPWHIAHRGCGKSFLLDGNIIRENTLKSFNLAVEHGADIVEFDVQLTKDSVPIIYHDFILNMSFNKNVKSTEYDIHHLPLTENEMTEILKRGKQDQHGFLKVPVRHFVLANLKRVEGYESILNQNFETSACVINHLLNKPFLTLMKALKKVPETISFDIDIKWPIQINNGSWEHCSEGDVNMNDFVDAIIDVLIKWGGKRNIILTSYCADICSMFALKQRIYPVLYLAKGGGFRDPRGKTLISAASFAYATELLGIGVPTTIVFEYFSDIVHVQQRGLQIIAWGDENRQKDTRKELTSLGIDGIIYDRINHTINPDDLTGTITMADVKEVFSNVEENEVEVIKSS